jgi:hypothetical protein
MVRLQHQRINPCMRAEILTALVVMIALTTFFLLAAIALSLNL